MYGQGPYGGNFQVPRNPYLAGSALVGLSLVQLILGLILLSAQVGLYYYCNWNAVCLVIPSFVACILFLITSIVGIATGIERTNGMILTLMVMSIITLIVTPVNMGMWGLEASEGGIPQAFSLIPNMAVGVDTTLATVYWGLLFIPVIEWILFVVVATIASFALCCPKYGRSRPYGGGPYGGGPPAVNPGYAPSPVYASYGPPAPMVMAPPQRPVARYPYF